MSSSYQPIPYSASDTVTVTAFDANLNAQTGECYQNTTYVTSTATASVEESSPRQYEPIVERTWRNADTSGSWREVRESGLIKMTPMSAGQSVTKNYLGSFLKDKHAVALAKGHGCANYPNCTGELLFRDHAFASINYIEQGDLTYWRTKYPTVPYLSLTEDFDSARWERIKSEAYQDLFQAYNLGEELYELMDTLRTLMSLLRRAYNLLANFKKVLDKLKRLKPKERAIAISKAWLELRYGILPIAYSIKDLLNLYNDSEGEYRTIRRTYNPPKSPIDTFPEDGNYFYEIGAVSTLYRVTVKGRWGSSASKVADLINVNPLLTALAVYKYSLVVRWFVNINSAFDSWVKAFTTSALQFNGVTSVKVVREISVYFHHEYDTTVTAYEPGNSICGTNFYGVYGPYTIGGKRVSDVLLQEHSEESYERELFLPNDVSFVWDPKFDLKRIIDALALLFLRFSRL